jgi:hypothetical protein
MESGPDTFFGVVGELDYDIRRWILSFPCGCTAVALAPCGEIPVDGTIARYACTAHGQADRS